MDKCPNCGEKVKPGDLHCSVCGKELKTKKYSSKLIIGVIAAILIIAIAGALASGVFNSTPSQTTVSDDSPVETVHPVEDNDSDSSASSEYWASSKAEKFHTPDCEWAQKISDNNKIVYQTREDAIEDGKVPCGVCNP